MSIKRKQFNKVLCKKHFDIKNLCLAFICVLLITALVINPAQYIKITFNGLLVWATVILPSLFPFMIFTRLLTTTGYVEKVSHSLSPATKKLYNCSGISSYVFLMSIISGYPLGAKITADLYEQRLINRGEAHRICSFTSNSGPMFIIGTVAVGMLVSNIVGYIILSAHVLSALLNGLIYRKYGLHDNTMCENPAQTNIATSTMESSILSVLVIGGYVTIFFVITEIIASLGLFYPFTWLLSQFGIETSISNGILFGFFEITKGCLGIATTTASLGIKAILCSLIISFGGLAVSFQAFAFLNKFKISKKFFFLQKITQAIIACALCTILVFIFNI